MFQRCPIIRRLFLTAMLLPIVTFVYANPPANFTQAKKKAETIFKTHRATLYCDCPYNEKKQIDLLSCQMQEA
ncbi:putative endonuclease-1, partial [Legionella drozanskii LLAP-1]